MTEQLDHHDIQEHPCVVCHAMVNTIAALRLALLNAQTDCAAAQQEAARLPHPRHSAAELNRELVEL
jgi:hypothetical protein